MCLFCCCCVFFVDVFFFFFFFGGGGGYLCFKIDATSRCQFPKIIFVIFYKLHSFLYDLQRKSVKRLISGCHFPNAFN